MKKLFLGLLLTFALVGCGTPAAPTSQANQNNKNVLSVSLDQSGEVIMEVGQVLEVTPTISFKDDNPVNVDTTWISSRNKVASVSEKDGKGVITALNAGSTVITYIAGYKSANFTVTINRDEPVTPPAPTQPSVALNIYNRNLEEGDSFVLVATVSNYEDTSVTFTSENPEVATVTAEGLVTAVKEGSTNIVVNTAFGISTSCSVTVVKQGEAPQPGPEEPVDPEDPEEPEEDFYDFYVYFFVDYNNIDEYDTTGTKLLARFGWYYDKPIGESENIPANPTTPLDPAFPLFVGWSTHTIIDTKDDLIDVNTYVVTNAHFLFIYGIWSAEAFSK